MTMGSKTDRRRKVRMAVVIAITAAFVAPTAVWAADRFTDVPDTNVFHSDITWLADAGVTLGCNPPDNTLYCPSDNVTREQMAAFMRRLAENQVVDAATAVDADTLDGLDSTVLATEVWGINHDWQDGQQLVDGPEALIELTVEPAGDGYLQVNATWGTNFNVAATEAFAWLQVDDSTCAFASRIPGTSMYAEGDSGTSDYQTQATTTVIPTTAGSHTITLCADVLQGSDYNVVDEAITALYAPNGSSSLGLVSEPATDSSDPDAG